MTPSRSAREAAGLTLEAAAKRARVSPAYLRKLEAGGQYSYVLAVRLSRIYGASGTAFISRGRRAGEEEQQGASGAESTGKGREMTS